MLNPANKNASNKGNNDTSSSVQINNDDTSSTENKDDTKATKLSKKQDGDDEK